jgi:protein-tyrosine phosphatase
MNVLFVCTGNICRSPMAEHLLRKLLTDAGINDVNVDSAGITPATQLAIPDEATAVLKEEGVSGVQHRPKGAEPSRVAWADVILVMQGFHREILVGRHPEAAGKIHLLKSFAEIGGKDPGIADPIGQSTAVYRRTLGEIKQALLKIIPKLKI